jgi:hypothetical protein
MAKLSITAAAKQWGMSRRTLSRRVSLGDVTVSSGTGRAKTVDTSEMLRVFGEPKMDTPVDSPVSMPVMSQDNSEIVALLKQQISRLESDNDFLKEELKRAHQRELMKLTHQTKSWWQRLK